MRNEFLFVEIVVFSYKPTPGDSIMGTFRVFVAVAFVAIGTSCGHADNKASQEKEVGERVYVWKNDKKPGIFPPTGWMPDGLGISQSESEAETPHSKPHCLRLNCQLSEKPWVGIYFLYQGEWEPTEKFDLFEKLSAKTEDHIKCRFWARAKRPVKVQFKVGGVTKGKIKDSLTFPVASKWIPLTSEWKMYEIDLTGRDVSSMVGGFMWVVDRARNGAKDVTFDLDDVYYVKTEKK
jgi:hypothetical protein